MTQAQFAWLLAYAAILRCAGAGLLPFVPERHLGPRRRQRVLAISYAATAVELAGALAVTANAIRFVAGRADTVSAAIMAPPTTTFFRNAILCNSAARCVRCDGAHCSADGLMIQ